MSNLYTGERLYTVSHEKRASLFSTVTLAFSERFFYDFRTVGNMNERSTVCLLNDLMTF